MIACLRFPFFPTSIERRDRAELCRQPLVLGGHVWQQERVYSFSAEAAQSGVRLGLSLRQARLVCPEATFQPPQPGHYNGVAGDLFARFLDWADRVEPQATRPALVFYADLDRAAQRLASEMGDAARKTTRLTPSIGLADTKFAAYLTARATAPGRLRGATSQTVPQTRIQTLSMDEKLKERLRLLGLETLGQLAQLPRAAVGEQFGRNGTRLHELACGEDHRAVQLPQREREETWQWQFDDAVRDTAIVRGTLFRGAAALAERLKTTHATTRTLTLAVHSEDGRQQTERIALSHPVRHTRHLTHHLHGLLDTIALTCGVTELHVRLEAVAPAQPRQLSLFDRSAVSRERHEPVLADLTARYGARLFVQLTALRTDARLLERRWQLQERPVVLP